MILENTKMTHFGLFCILYFLHSTLRNKTSILNAKELSEHWKDYTTLTIISVIGKIILAWIAAGALLPYVHKYLPL